MEVRVLSWAPNRKTDMKAGDSKSRRPFSFRRMRSSFNHDGHRVWDGFRSQALRPTITKRPTNGGPSLLGSRDGPGSARVTFLQLVKPLQCCRRTLFLQLGFDHVKAFPVADIKEGLGQFHPCVDVGFIVGRR